MGNVGSTDDRSPSGNEASEELDILREVERRITQHPAYKEHGETESLARTINTVFVPNWRELLGLLNQATNDVALAVELIQNMYRPDVRNQFHAQTAQRLHNYTASTMTLVDHVRRIMRGRTGPIAEAFEERKRELLSHPEVPFMQDLRNFTLHRSLPILAHRLSVTNVNAPGQTMDSEVELSVTSLREWDRWTSPSLSFLAQCGEVVVLRPVVQEHGERVLTFNNWLHDELSMANAAGLDELNKLVAARNAALAGTDLPEAERLTQEWTTRRDTPRPS
jgi:hypothetical protein